MYYYEKLPLVSIVPGGVLKAQLRAQLDGLSGHIDEVFPDLDMNNAWLGGTGEAWERGPYYLSGLIPLAFLTQDQRALERMHLWVESILERQREDGDFGPARNCDWWPRMIVLKAFAGYFRATDDIRILDFMERYFKYQYEQIDRQPLYFWASARAFEAMEAIDLLYSRRPRAFLKDLVVKLQTYSYDFCDLFEHFPYSKPMTSYISKSLFNAGKKLAEMLDSRDKKDQTIKSRPSRESILKFNRGRTVSLIMKTHGVNLAMALKYPATFGAFTEQPQMTAISQKGYEELFRYHGNGTGLFSSDEHLMGTSPAQGVELCTVVEMMYSLEEIGRVSPALWAYELLESIAYNALPAMFTPDMHVHQYVQQANQAASNKARRQFFDADSYANTFGVAPNYGCCAANMHAGFPLFAGYLALRHKKGLAFPVYGDCTVRTIWEGEPLEISETSNYPFDDTIHFHILKAKGEIELHFRPISNTDFTVSCNGRLLEVNNAEEVAERMIHMTAKEGDEIEIGCKPLIKTVTNPDGSKSIRYGNLLMALELEAREIYIKGTKPFHDRGFITTDDYNRTPFIKGDRIVVEEIIHNPVSAMPFSGAPVRLVVRGVHFEGGRMKKHSVRMPRNNVVLPKQAAVLTLVPYGTTRLRISHFPSAG